jgi:hypothetical protein
VLGQAHLAVELHEAGDLRYLAVRSLIDAHQTFLLPLPAPPAINGLALATPLGRWHDLPWGLAWGDGVPPEGCTVVFSGDALRFRSTAKVQPQVLADHCWVADAEGVFTTAATVVAGVETARVPLATRY